MFRKTMTAALIGSLFAVGAAQAATEIDGSSITSRIAHNKAGDYHYFGDAISISNASNTNAGDTITVSSGANVVIGGEDTSTIRVEQTRSDAYNGALFAVKGDNGLPGTVTFQATDRIDILSESCGIWAQNNTQSSPRPEPHTTVNLPEFPR